MVSSCLAEEKCYGKLNWAPLTSYFLLYYTVLSVFLSSHYTIQLVMGHYNNCLQLLGLFISKYFYMFSNEGCILVLKWYNPVCMNAVFSAHLIQNNRIVNSSLLKVQKTFCLLWITQGVITTDPFWSTSEPSPFGTVASTHRSLTLHFLGLDTTCKTVRSAGEACLHLQLRISLELCKVLGRMYRERKIYFKALSQPQDWLQPMVSLPDLSFPPMYMCTYRTCFSAIMNRAVEVLQDMT